MVSSYLHNTQSKEKLKRDNQSSEWKVFPIFVCHLFSSLSLSLSLTHTLTRPHTHTHSLSLSLPHSHTLSIRWPQTLFLPFFLSNNNNNPQRRRGRPPEVMKIAWWCNSSWILSNIFFQWLQPLSWKTFQGQVDQKTGLDFLLFFIMALKASLNRGSPVWVPEDFEQPLRLSAKGNLLHDGPVFWAAIRS